MHACMHALIRHLRRCLIRPQAPLCLSPEACRAQPAEEADLVPSQPESMASGQQEPLLLVSYGAPMSYGAPGGEPRRLCPVLPRPEARRMHGRIYLLFTSALFLGLAAYLLVQSTALLRAAEVASQSLWLPGSDMCAALVANNWKTKAPEADLFGCSSWALLTLSMCIIPFFPYPAQLCLPVLAICAGYAARAAFRHNRAFLKDRLSLAALATWCWQ